MGVTEGVRFATNVAAVLGCGVMGGLYFAFSTSVMKALARLPASQGMAAMQSINVAILNPLFLTVFVGTAVCCALALFFALTRRSDPGAMWVVAGAVVYLAGSVMVTAVCNVPMNDALAAVSPGDAHGADRWASYLVSWTAWNHVRTVASVGAMAALVLGLRAGWRP